MTSTAEISLDSADDAGSLLAYARSRRAAADQAEAELLQAAAAYAAIHATGDVVAEEDWLETSVPIAGAGAPEISEFCIAEFAAALGMSTDAGRRYLGQALELANRLSPVWRRLVAGELPAWRARRIADATMALSMGGAASVAAQVAPIAHRVGVATVDRLVEEARVRFDPEEAELRAAEAAEARHADVHLASAAVTGIVDVSAAVDLPDAVDLEQALRAGAALLAEQGSTEPLDVRRARALGLLARGELTLEAATRSRPISLHLHASADPTSPLVRVEETDSFVLLDRLTAWCLDPARQLDVKPVLDLAGHVHVGAYEVPDRLAEQARLRDVTCVHPYCTRRARRCDCDHVVAYDRGGTTCTCNIAPLCRRHHRLKTQTAWTYTVLEPGTYLWTSPHGYQFVRDPIGTRDVTDRRNLPASTGCTDPDPPPGDS